MTPFKDYLAYIQATNTNSNPEYKHSISLLSDLDQAGSTFQTITANTVDCHGDKGGMVKKLKLDKGVDSQLPTIKDLKESIKKLETRLAEMIAAELSTIEKEL